MILLRFGCDYVSFVVFVNEVDRVINEGLFINGNICCVRSDGEVIGGINIFVYRIGFVAGIIHVGMVVFRISHKWIAGKCLEIANMYNDKETKRMAFLFDTNPYWHIMVKEEAFPLQIYDFEDVKMPLPACEDKKLRKMYGNYMELPPVEKRKNHYPYKLEFND